MKAIFMKELLKFANEEKKLDKTLREITNNKGIIYNTLHARYTFEKRIV